MEADQEPAPKEKSKAAERQAEYRKRLAADIKIPMGPKLGPKSITKKERSRRWRLEQREKNARVKGTGPKGGRPRVHPKPEEGSPVRAPPTKVPYWNLMSAAVVKQ